MSEELSDFKVDMNGKLKGIPLPMSRQMIMNKMERMSDKERAMTVGLSTILYDVIRKTLMAVLDQMEEEGLKNQQQKDISLSALYVVADFLETVPANEKEV